MKMMLDPILNTNDKVAADMGCLSLCLPAKKGGPTMSFASIILAAEKAGVDPMAARMGSPRSGRGRARSVSTGCRPPHNYQHLTTVRTYVTELVCSAAPPACPPSAGRSQVGDDAAAAAAHEPEHRAAAKNQVQHDDQGPRARGGKGGGGGVG